MRFIQILPILFLLPFTRAFAQQPVITGTVVQMQNLKPIAFAQVFIKNSGTGSQGDDQGNFTLEIGPSEAEEWVFASAVGFEVDSLKLTPSQSEYNFTLRKKTDMLDEVVVSGTLKELTKSASPLPIEVYSAKFFKSNPTPSLFEALQHINGVRPQLNCNVCNTGDVHINGMEGPYTLILIDGMPIVSGLSSVYGLFGIPQALIDRIEVMKGPASTLYGSEAVGGLINVITRLPSKAPILSGEAMTSSWGEINVDAAAKFRTGKNAYGLTGINYFNYSKPFDKNNDGFTDVTLQHRLSIFQKWQMNRKHNRQFSLAGRYINEDRWGGEMNWNKKFRGGDSVYGESIYTKRWEAFGLYQLPLEESVFFQFSLNGHNQNSAYGKTIFLAQQNIGFAQVYGNKQWGNQDLTLGMAYRYTFYDDNSAATATIDSAGNAGTQESITHLPGIFLQDQWNISKQHTLLLGFRYDYHFVHGSILSPRINYKWQSKNNQQTLRIGVGNGYRAANIFTEDHAALTGARKIVFQEKIEPEKSWNANINWVQKWYSDNGLWSGIDASIFYTRFSNKIIPDYDTDPNIIFYRNLNGHADSRGLSVNADFNYQNRLTALLGFTLMDVSSVQNNQRQRPLFTENFSGVWSVGYLLPAAGIKLDYTGNVYSPMRLPLLSQLDPRLSYSPWWSIQNIQFTKTLGKWEIFTGLKNLLNWTPNKGNPFIIARAHDPFDKNVTFDSKGDVIPTAENPHALTFDPTYVYGPNQGRRAFLGLRLTIK